MIFVSIVLAGILFFLGWLIDEVKGMRKEIKSFLDEACALERRRRMTAPTRRRHND